MLIGQRNNRTLYPRGAAFQSPPQGILRLSGIIRLINIFSLSKLHIPISVYPARGWLSPDAHHKGHKLLLRAGIQGVAGVEGFAPALVIQC